MTSTRPTRRWMATTAKIVLASGAIAAGAMALSPAAQADAQFDAFEHSCISNPGAYVAGAVRGVYRVQTTVVETDQICSLYGPPRGFVGAKWLGDYTRQSYAQTKPGDVHPG